MEPLKEKYERFKEWQVKPHEVAPLTTDLHECATCGTQFHGNFCPRCGQKSTIGRYSFKTAFLLFLDVWGLGNRGMFRTIRDLLLRPGYMIRDYLNGMQMAYFPPFKMFFLAIALSVLVESGLNIRMENVISNSKEQISKNLDNSSERINETDKVNKKSFDEATINDTININGKQIAIEKGENSDNIKLNGKTFGFKVIEIIKKFSYWIMDNQTIAQFFIILFLSGPMYLLFRHNKKISDIRYSEFFVSMVYITNFMTIISIIGEFFSPGNPMVDMVAYVLSFVPLKQLYGYSYKLTILKVIGAFILLFLAATILIAIIAVLAGLYIEYIL